MPIVSVVIPVYNGEKTIRETINCVLNQSLSDFELLVVNDGSKDSTLEIVSRIQDPRLKVFSYPNAGLAATRNRGISLSSSDYISFIDADDLWTPDKLEAQLKALEDNPQAAIAYSWTDCIDESSQFLRKGGYLTVNGDVYSQLLVVDFLESGSNPLFRKQALIEVGGFDESLTAAEDWDILLRLAARYPFVAVPSPQILYRVSATSMSANVERQEATCLKVLERAYSQAPASLKYLKKYSMANLYKYLTYKALEGTPERKKGLIAARFFMRFVISDRVLLRKRFIWKILLKIILWIFLSPEQAQRLIQAQFKTLPHIHTTLLTQFQIEPF
jgi:glycosyltransferase involved in cell wall biosynthesis